MTVHVNRELERAQRAARRGFEALGRKPPEHVDTRWNTEERRSYDRHREAQQRAQLAVLDAGRSLIAAAADLEERARQAREAGVEALRHAWPPLGWRELGDLLELSGQGAHKRYRHLDGPEPELTIDDELSGANR